MNLVTVIDAPCGHGKTTHAIQQINRTPDARYVFCTPYLSEIKRIQNNCRKTNGEIRFSEPRPYGHTKLEDFNLLLAAGKDIAVTHSTFLNTNAETVNLLKNGHYTLILDEALDVIIDFNKAHSVERDTRQSINKADITAMLNHPLISVAEDYRVTWLGGEYETAYKFSAVAKYAEMNRLYSIRNSIMLLMFPPELFRCFDDVYVLTYNFEGTLLRYYFEYHEIKYEKASVIQREGGWHVIPYDPAIDYEFRKKCASLILICDDVRLNSLFKTPTALSKSWYLKNGQSDNPQLKLLKNNIGHYFNRYLEEANASSGAIMWTCPKDYAKKLKGKGYTIQRSMTKEEKILPDNERKELEDKLSCFVPCNARATNKYRSRWALAYCGNMYFQPHIKALFDARTAGPITLDDDAFALASLLQWIFRSRIRDGEPICIYLPSPRMRNLLISWITSSANSQDAQTDS